MEDLVRKNIYDRKCKSCEKIFQGGPRAWYCHACREERRVDRDRMRRKHGTVRPIGSADFCAICGQAYAVEGGLQKYCRDCKDEAYRAVDRKQGVDYYQSNKDTINPARYEKRRSPDIVSCANCAKPLAHGGTCKKYCDECLPQMKKKWQRKADQRRRKKMNFDYNNKEYLKRIGKLT